MKSSQKLVITAARSQLQRFVRWFARHHEKRIKKSQIQPPNQNAQLDRIVRWCAHEFLLCDEDTATQTDKYERHYGLFDDESLPSGSRRIANLLACRFCGIHRLVSDSVCKSKIVSYDVTAEISDHQQQHGENPKNEKKPEPLGVMLPSNENKISCCESRARAAAGEGVEVMESEAVRRLAVSSSV